MATALGDLREAHLETVDDDGAVRVDGTAVRVLSTVPLADLQRALREGLPVLLAGEPPIIVGVIQGQAALPPARVVIAAARELVLTSGAAAIRIAADGTVRLEGRDIRSAARRLQRLTGAQVRIN